MRNHRQEQSSSSTKRNEHGRAAASAAAAGFAAVSLACLGVGINKYIIPHGGDAGQERKVALAKVTGDMQNLAKLTLAKEKLSHGMWFTYYDAKKGEANYNCNVDLGKGSFEGFSVTYKISKADRPQPETEATRADFKKFINVGTPTHLVYSALLKGDKDSVTPLIAADVSGDEVSYYSVDAPLVSGRQRHPGEYGYTALEQQLHDSLQSVVEAAEGPAN